MKVLANYTFSASAKTVTFTDYTPVLLASVLLITNVTDGIIIYKFNDPSLGGTVATNILTLDYDTTSMSDSDKLQVWYEDTTVSLATSGKQDTTNTEIGATSETAAAGDTSTSGLNGLFKRLLQRVTTLITAIGNPFQANGSIGNTAFGATQSGTWTVQPGNTANTTAWKVDGSAVTQPVSAASLPLPSGAATSAKQDTGNTSVASIDTKTPSLGQALAAASSPVVLTAAQITTLTPPAAITGFLTESDFDTKTGSLTETAPATDTASSGNNGRLQRIAQRITSLIALIPTSLGQKTKANSFAVVIASDQDTLAVSLASVPSHAVTNAGTFVVQENGAALTSLQLIDDVVYTDDTSTHSTGSSKGIGVMAVATPTDAAVDANDIGMVAMTTSRQLKVDASGVAVPITDNSGSITVDNGGTFAVQATLQTQTDTVMIGGVNIKEINAVTPLMGNGTTGTGSQRVTIASDNTAFSVNATLSAETTKVIGTTRNVGNGGAVLDGVNTAATAPANGLMTLGIYNSTEPSPTTGQSVGVQLDAKGRTRQVLMDAAGNTRGANVNASNQLSVSVDNTVTVGSHAVTNAGTFAVQATLQANSGVDIGKLTANQSVNVAQLNGVTVSMGSGVMGTGVQRVAIASDNDALIVKQATAGNLNATVVGTGTFAVQAASAGDVAHDGVDSGNPVKVGGKATNVEPTAVSATGDRTNFITDMVGKQIVLPYSNPENFVSGAITSAMTGTTSTSLVAAPAAGLRNYITTIIVSNSHATVGTDVIIQDGTGGTTLLTIPAAAVYGGAVITLPTPLRQPTTATALFCANVTTGASTKVSAVGYKGI